MPTMQTQTSPQAGGFVSVNVRATKAGVTAMVTWLGSADESWKKRLEDEGAIVRKVAERTYLGVQIDNHPEDAEKLLASLVGKVRANRPRARP